MKPEQFSWTEDQTVTVINPTKETHQFKVHNKAYEVGGGKSARMPGYMAWVFVYEMAVKLCQDDGKFNRWNEEEFRQEYFKLAVAGADPVLQDIQPVEEKPLVEPVEDDDTEEEGDEAEPKPGTGVNYEVKPMTPKVTSGKSSSRA